MTIRHGERMKAAYSVCVIGFNTTENLVLGSIFGLAARRTPKFIRHPDGAVPPDIYLVDADDAAAMASLRAANADGRVPVVLVGTHAHGTPWQHLPRPLQWARLFAAFDVAVQAAGNDASAEERDGRQAATDTAAEDPDATIVVGRSPVPRPGAIVPDDAAARPSGDVLVAEGIEAPAPFDLNEVEAAACMDPSAGAEAARVGDAQASPPGALPQVLVVDDTLLIREYVRSKIEPLGVRVDCAASGEEALALVAAQHYACVFLDIVLPGIDGYQVCKALKTRRCARPTAVVMISSKASTLDRIRGKMAGCDDYLAKPLDEPRLYEAIARFLPAGAAA